MTKKQEEWILSIRDDSNHRINNNKKPKQRTPEEIEKIKQGIIERHKYLGLDENLKKEIYPHLFR